MAWMEMDWNLKKIDNFVQVLMLRVQKILKAFIMAAHLFICYLRRSFTEAFCLWFKPQSNDFRPELT